MSKFSFATLFASATAALAFGAVPAMADTAESTLVHDGEKFVYSVAEQADQRVITGKRYPGGSDFRLVVRNGKVAGTVDGQSVAFNVAEAKGAASGKSTRISLR